MPPIPAFSVRSLALLLLACVGCDPTKSESLESGQPKDSETGVITSPDDSDSVVAETGCQDSDEELPVWYYDSDQDGYGSITDAISACEAPIGYIATSGDCDDTDATVNPIATETCNSVDDNCDSQVDEGFDADVDGYSSTACVDGTDCDDADATVNPGATDTCGDGIDADCSGEDERCPYDGDLADADAKRWAAERGDDAGDHLDVGDVDGDGIEDVVVGAMWSDGYTGKAWLFYGPFSGDEALAVDGIQLKGGPGAYEAGRTIGLGDTDADGYDDILIGSPDSGTYDAVVINGPVTDDMTFSDADIRFTCSASIECGHGGDLTDLDGDGFKDALIAAGEDNTAGYYAGAVYVFYGPLDSGESVMTTSSDAILLGGSVSSETGRIIRASGDFDGDGVGDALITASYDADGGPYAGAVHVVYGPADGTTSLNDADGKLVGAAPYDYAGESSAMGDVNGDGLSDAIVGSYASASSAGNAYVVYGPASGTTSLSSADADVHGRGTQYMGSAVISRDIDGDGFDELIVGADADSSAGSGAGAAYLFFGPISGGLSSSDAFTTFTGEKAADTAGSNVGIGDIDGNGQNDILIGAKGESTGGSGAGAMYLILTGS